MPLFDACAAVLVWWADFGRRWVAVLVGRVAGFGW
jgi:hypothetical protein